MTTYEDLQRSATRLPRGDPARVVIELLPAKPSDEDFIVALRQMRKLTEASSP